MNLKNKILLFSLQWYQKKERFYPWKCHMWRDNDQKDVFMSNKRQLQNHSSNFIHKTKSFFRAAIFYLVYPCLTMLLLPWTSQLVQLYGIWQKLRQICAIFMVEKRFHLIGCKTRSFQEKKQRFPIGTKSHNGRCVFRAVFAIKESAGHCSRKLC